MLEKHSEYTQVGIIFLSNLASILMFLTVTNCLDLYVFDILPFLTGLDPQRDRWNIILNWEILI